MAAIPSHEKPTLFLPFGVSNTFTEGTSKPLDKITNTCTILLDVCHLEVCVMFKEFLFGTKADMVERGLILAAIVATAMAAWTTLGGNIKTKIEAISTQITSTP